MARIQPFENNPERYDKWFDENKAIYESELQAVRELLPEKGNGIEVGVGTGRFAAPLGIHSGVEPSPKMREIAKKRGINVVDGVAESLPYRNSEFDFVLMVTTVCFLDDVDRAFKEIYRVLKPNGCFVNGFIDKGSPVGRSYREKKENPFYSEANFYSVEDISNSMEKSGFKKFSYRQTIFHPLSAIEDVEPVKPGYSEGSFVVVRGMK